MATANDISNSYLSQYYEAMSLNAMGIPQQLNWEALYPAYPGDSFWELVAHACFLINENALKTCPIHSAALFNSPLF